MIDKVFDLPIKQKLLLIVIFPNIVSLVIVSLLLLLLEINEFQKNAQDDLSAIASIIANRSTAALLYNDEKLAQENIAVIDSLPAVESACIYNANDMIFTQRVKKEQRKWTCPSSVKGLTTRFTDTHLCVIQPILIGKEQQGIVYIRADLADAYWRKIQFVGILFAGLLAVSILVFFLSAPLLRFISVPINKLVAAVKKITEDQDYSLRAVKINNDELGVLVDVFNNLIDTVDKKNKAVLQAKNRYHVLYHGNPSIMFNIKANGNIISINKTCADQLGLDLDIIKQYSVFDFVYTMDMLSMKAFIESCLLSPLQVHKQEFRNIDAQGGIIWLRVAAKVIEQDRENSLLLVCEDITEARELSERITYQASHDALTGLANRSEFDRYIKQAIELIYTDNCEHAFCYLDLDQFKIINDTCGHLAGDELLRQLGVLLKNNIPSQDIVARLGGDEFGLLMYNCSLIEASLFCEKICDIIKEFRFYWEGKSFTVAVSIGISAINQNNCSVVNIFKEADSACYAAKERGRNRIHIYSPDDEELALRQGEMQWVEKIQQGIENNLFCLYGQPIVLLSKQDQGLHFETLIRYRDKQGMIIPPNAFLPAAERYGLSPVLDRWVISSLFEFIATTPDFLEKLSLCAVNLSGLSFCEESMLPFIIKQFDVWKIPTNKICFEITETAAIANLSYAIKFINALKMRGCLFSLDDFGSGLSSFGYLKNLPVDYLKIDGAFVRDILVDRIDYAMVKSINEVGHIMGKKTIAEFVENETVFNLLHELGVDYAQGYGIGKPVLLSELKLIKPFVEPKK